MGHLPIVKGRLRVDRVMKARWLRLILLTMLGLVVIVVLLGRADLQTIARILLSMDWRWFAGSLAFGVLSHIINGYRIRSLLDTRIPVVSAIAISTIHMFFLNLMPFRSGEVSFIVLSRKYMRARTMASVTGLGIQRFWDLVILALLGIVSCIITALEIQSLFYITLVSTVCLLVGISICVVLLLIGPPAVNAMTNRLHGKVIHRIKTFFIQAMDMLRWKTKRSKLTLIALLSLTYWGLVVVQTYGCFAAFQRLGFSYYIVVCTLVSLWAIMPVHGFLAVGTSECAMVFLLSRMGMDLNASLGITLGFRAVILLSMSLFGLSGILFLSLFSRKSIESVSEHIS